MRSTFAVLWLALVAPVLVSGCATSGTVESAAIDAGISQDFTASYDLVKAAALEAVERMNVNVDGSDETAERFQIRFTKSISAFSWGEVGVVNVVRAGEGARVYVNSEKRSRAQVTGTSERQFADEIFRNIAESLARPPA